MRLILWTAFALILLCTLVLLGYLLKHKESTSLASSLSIADITGLLSLALNAALFLMTILSLAIAVAAFKASERSGEQQQKTLDDSRTALRQTADILVSSAEHFKQTAEAAQGQYTLSQTERREREEAVRRALVEELHFNKRAITDNEVALRTELEALKSDRSLITPLQALHSGAWELLRVYLPRQLTADPSTLAHVATVYRLTQRINEMISSREEYRVHNQAMDNYGRRMTAYDDELQGLNGEISGILPTVLTVLEGRD